MTLTIDAHQHFWQLSAQFDYTWLETPSHAPIRRDFLPRDLEPLLGPAGISRTIVVQTQHNTRETQWALELAERHSFIAGVVGWVDLASADCNRQLFEVVDHRRFVGVRHVTQDEPDDDFIVREDVISGLKVLEGHDVPFDLLFYVKHLRHAATLARRLPALRMVIDHLAKPLIRDQRRDGWLTALRAAARFPNVYCKLSGMVTEADWKAWEPADLRPYVEAALEAFGPERLMFGSDWPVCLLAASYAEVKAALIEALGPISPSEHAAIFGGTAAQFYGIPS
jgi:L-fuconolactonase